MLVRSKVAIEDIAVVKGGDKGDDCHVAIVPESHEAYEAIWQDLTPEALNAHLRGVATRGISRYRLPNIDGIVVVLHGAFAGGVCRGWLLDRRMPLAVHVGEFKVRVDVWS